MVVHLRQSLSRGVHELWELGWGEAGAARRGREDAEDDGYDGALVGWYGARHLVTATFVQTQNWLAKELTGAERLRKVLTMLSKTAYSKPV